MGENLHPNKETAESDNFHGSRREETLLDMLAETFRVLGAVRRCRDHHNEMDGGRKDAGEEEEDGREGVRGHMQTPGEVGEEEREENEGKQKVLRVLRELSVLHSQRVTAWRDVLSDCMHKSPQGGGAELQPSKTDTEPNANLCLDSFCETFHTVGKDLKDIGDKLNTILTKLDRQILKLGAEEATTLDAALQQARDPPTECLECDSRNRQDTEDGDYQSPTEPSQENSQISETRLSLSNCNEQGVKGQSEDNEEYGSPDTQIDFQEVIENDSQKEVKSEEEMNNNRITVGLPGFQKDQNSEIQGACFIKAPPDVSEVLRCEVVDTLSFLLVTGLEELVSRVIKVEVKSGRNFQFPVTVVVPFSAQYRGNCREVAVKMVDKERRASYVTPVTTEGTYGGQRGSFAEVRVYSLGLFAVVSHLKRENYTIPTKGLSLKLPMDPRVCLNYLPGTFTAPVMAQTTIQPVDAVLLAAVKIRSDAYHSVVSTSPILHLTHPSSQPLRRPFSLTLPCPPNPEKKRRRRGEEENQDNIIRPVNASPIWDLPAANRRMMKSKEMSNEMLVVLGSRDKQWSVLDKVTVRNQQKGVVSFELTEIFDKLLVVRLLSTLQPGDLTSLAEELEESAHRHAVTIVLQRRPDEPHAVLVAALPSRDINWELSKLRAQGYEGVPETSCEISMCEGDQLLLSFSGNITSAGAQNVQQRLTFHSQQKNHLLLHLTEVDRFGNYSSPHYKGTAMFHKVTRGQLERRGDGPAPVDTKLLGDPVCKLSLTLPKKVRNINRPVMARVKLCEETDSLSDSLLLWLSGELSKEEVALLVLSLRLRRSAAQLVKLRAGDNLSSQAFHVLAMWRRGLPAATHQPKAAQLARCLAKSGRPDLARELLLRQGGTSRSLPLQLCDILQALS